MWWSLTIVIWEIFINETDKKISRSWAEISSFNKWQTAWTINVKIGIVYAVLFYPPCSKFIYGPRPVVNGLSNLLHWQSSCFSLCCLNVFEAPCFLLFLTFLYFSLIQYFFMTISTLWVLGKGLRMKLMILIFFICLINKYLSYYYG